MTCVWKYEMKGSRATFEMPALSEVLSVGSHRGNIVLWAEVDPAMPRGSRIFRATGTGEQLPPDRVRFCGTVQMPGSRRVGVLQDIVWHVYETTA